MDHTLARNMAPVDRAVRVLVGVALVVAGLFIPDRTWAILVAALGGVQFHAAATGY